MQLARIKPTAPNYRRRYCRPRVNAPRDDPDVSSPESPHLHPSRRTFPRSPPARARVPTRDSIAQPSRSR